MHLHVRIVVAVLFVASVLAAAVVGGGRDDARREESTSVQAPLSPSTTLAPPESIPETTTTAPAAPEVTQPATTLPPPAPVPANQARILVSATGVVLAIQGQEPGGQWRVTTPCGRTAVVAGGTPMGAVQVVLDAGHGGDEPGAVGPTGLQEKELNLAVVNEAKAALERAGVTVVLTRSADYRISLGSRARVVHAAKPIAFVSVHHNAEPDGPFSKPGSETYYQVASAESKRLSGLLYEEIVAALSQFQAPWVADTDAGAKYRKNDKGEDYYGILRHTAGVTASLAELGFISNGPEEDLYRRPEVRKVEGEAVAKGILRFLTTKDPGSGFTEPYPRSSPAGSGGGPSPSCVDPPF